MKLYRFLNDKGNGLYQDKFHMRVGLVFDGADIPFYQPPLYEDVRGFKWADLDKHYCAFETPDQMMSWMRDIDPLIIFTEGGKLMEITIDDEYVLKGRHQCIYRKHRSILEREIGIDEFIDLVHIAEIKWKEFWSN